MAGNIRRKSKFKNVLLIFACILLMVGLVALLGWNRKEEARHREQLEQLAEKDAQKEEKERKAEEKKQAQKKAEEDAAKEAEANKEAEDAAKKEADASAPGIVCWGDDLINGEESATYSYMAVLTRILQENGYDLPVVNKTLQGGGTLSMMKMAGVSDAVLQDYIAAHQAAAGGAQPYVTETGIRDLTPEQLDRSDKGYVPIIFMGYYGGWNHDPVELGQQQEHILNTFDNKERFIVVGTRPVDDSVDSATLDAALSAKWGEHYISLASVTTYPSARYEAQEAMAQAIYQKLVDLAYIKK